MEGFWDYSVWGWIALFAVLFASLIVANTIKRVIPFLRESLLPTSVLGGLILLVISAVYKAISGEIMFNATIFGGNGMENLEIITYHALALGFIASAFKTNDSKLSKQRFGEIFNTGVTTVSSYLIQGIFGLAITMIVALIIKDFFYASGLLLPFGYGQGTGQALIYGGIYQDQYGFDGGRSFGLTIAALGFLSASLGGVVHLNIMKKKGKITIAPKDERSYHEKLESRGEIPMQDSMDKMTVQLAFVMIAYILTFLIMFFVGKLLENNPTLKAVVYGFNFLIGVLVATLIKLLLNFMRRKRIMKKKYLNNFLMTRASNLFFDIMVVAGIAAIRLDVLENYWGIMIILGVVGLVITYVYNRIVAKTLFPSYAEEQFLMMYGMLTGTASTGIILLREVDGDFKTPAAENMVYQNFPAIILGFPITILATYAPVHPFITLMILIGFFVVLNIVLFRKQIFKRKNKN